MVSLEKVLNCILKREKILSKVIRVISCSTILCSFIGEDLSMLSLYYDDDLVNDQFQLNLIDRSKRHVRDKTHRTKHRGTKRRSRNHMKRRKGHSQHTIDHLTRKLRRKHTSSRHD